MDDKDNRLVEGNFDIVKNLADNRQVKITGFIYKDEPIDQINARIDKFCAALDRQADKADIAKQEEALASMQGHAEMVGQQYGAIIAKRQGGAKLSSAELKKMEEYNENAEKNKAAIAVFAKQIAEAKKKLNGTAHVQ
jgi:hypothetical protein